MKKKIDLILKDSSITNCIDQKFLKDSDKVFDKISLSYSNSKNKLSEIGEIYSVKDMREVKSTIKSIFGGKDEVEEAFYFDNPEYNLIMN